MRFLENLRSTLIALCEWLSGFFWLVVCKYRIKGCQKSAASLTYVTLFATVPMLTVTFSMFSLIPAFQDLGSELQALLFMHFLPNSEQDLGRYLTEFAAQARQLTAFGFGFLLVSAYLMLKNIEANFNAIWGVNRGRRGVANFLLYWAILSLGPLLLGAALAMSTYLTSLRLVVGTYDSLGLIEWILHFAPWILTWAAFTLLFVAVPNCKVSVRHALVGGLLTTIGFQGLKAAFSWVVGHSSFTLVYGAFAALPLFLLWINLTWTLVLGGAVFVHTISAYQIGRRDRSYPDLVAALLVLWRCYEASKDGVFVQESVLLQQGLSAEQWQRIRIALMQHHVIAANSHGEFLLGLSLHHLSVQQLANILALPHQLPEDSDALRQLPWGQAGVQLLSRAEQELAALFSVTVGELFDSTGADSIIAGAPSKDLPGGL